MSLPNLLLGLLDACPMSGYDLNKVFSTTIQHFWSTDQSQIYRTLYKLEEDGKVGVETIFQEDNPNKKVYHVTEIGQAALQKWLSVPLPNETIREAWLGQLYFSHRSTNAEVIGVLTTYMKGVQERLNALEALQATMPTLAGRAGIPREFQFQLLTLDYGLEIQRFEVEWIKKAIRQIEQYPDKS